MTIALTAYVGVMEWGPRIATDRGLMIQVSAQKLIAIVGFCALAYQLYEAQRVAERESVSLTRATNA
jgi:hypothetical protein